MIAAAPSVFLALLKDAGLPAPEIEYVFAPPRRWRFDYAWRDKHVALEVEGGVWTMGRHIRGAGFLADMEKYNRAAVREWCVLRVVPSQLCTAATIELLRQAFLVRLVA
jgi:hypothetical protein